MSDLQREDLLANSRSFGCNRKADVVDCFKNSRSLSLRKESQEERKERLAGETCLGSRASLARKLKAAADLKGRALTEKEAREVLFGTKEGAC